MIVLAVMRVANGWPHNFVPKVQSNCFPEIPESPLDRIAGSYAFCQPAKDQPHQNSRHHLKHHKLGELQAKYFGQTKVQLAVTVTIDDSTGNIKAKRIANVMKGIFV
jgi:hypothetical protein